MAGPVPARDLGKRRFNRRAGGQVTEERRRFPPAGPDRRCAVDLDMDVSSQGGRTVLAVGGEIDVYTAPSLQSRAAEVIEEATAAGNPPRLVIDLSGVTFIDSTGLGVLVAVQNRAQDEQGSLVVVCSTERILKLLRLTGLTDVLTIKSSVEDAVA
jgi:anti-sigma B factor antagonist